MYNFPGNFSNASYQMKRIGIPIKISLKFVPKGAIDNKSAMVQVMSWQRKGDKPLPVSMLTQFTDAYVRH